MTTSLHEPPDPTAVTAPVGTSWCRAWGRQLDDALRRWLQADPARSEGLGLAVVALGSYARQEVCPHSDIDLLFLHDGWRDSQLQQVVEGLCYPLWDAGLQVGYAIHTPRSAVKAAGQRTDTATALMDRRLVAGDSGLLDQVAVAYGRWLRRRSGKVLTQLAAADEARHQRAGLQPGMLEPELKAGAGGLRDLHSLRWAAGMVLGEVGLQPLVGARYLGATDYQQLIRANEVLLTARCALHLVSSASAPTDVLRLDLQDEVAALLGDADRDHLLARVGLALRTIAHVHGRTWPLLLSDALSGRRRQRPPPVALDDGVVLVDGLVEITPQASLAHDPGLGLRAVASAAIHGSHLGRATVTRLQRELSDRAAVEPGAAEALPRAAAEPGAAEALPRAAAEPGSAEALQVPTLPWDSRMRAAFLTTLRQGPAALPALADADHIGLLTAHLPQWRRVRGRPQRNPYHRYDLDTHLLQTMAWVQRIAEAELDPRLPAIYERLNEPDVLLLAAIFHDVGKAWPGDHAVAGARVVSGWLHHMGVDQRRAQRVTRLIRLHLLLPDIAQHRDLDDRREIRAVADKVVDTETLDALLIMSLADARATGPSAYSPWKDGLLIELHARARRALTGGHGSALIAAPQTKVDSAHARSDEVPAGALERLLAHLPERYLLVADVEQILDHARLLDWLDPGEFAVASVRPGEPPTTSVISVVGRDRLGLLADLVGALAGLGLDVLEARAFTRDDGTALDWFVVRSRKSAAPRSADQVVEAVEAAGRDGANIEAQVSRQERRWDERPGTEAQLITTSVTVDTIASGARIEVEGRDVPGVLYRLLRVLAAQALDVTAARVATLGPQVRDVFFVSTADFDHQAVADHLRKAVSAEG